MRSRVLVLLSKCTNRKAALNGFQAITDAATREQMPHNPKVGALCEVIASLSNKELEYLNLLQSERRLE